MIEVQVVSASWCKSCDVAKPQVLKMCEMKGATMSVVDYDELEDVDGDLHAQIKSLPTIRMRVADGAWTHFSGTGCVVAWTEALLALP